MADRLESARFRPSFESEEKTGVTLAQLLSSRSVLLQGQAQDFSHFPAGYRIITLIKTTISILTVLQFTRRYLCDVQVGQVSNGAISSDDALVDLLESIEQMLECLDSYTRIVLVEVLSTLTVVTNDLKQGRPSEWVLADVIPYSPRVQSSLRRDFSERRTSTWSCRA